jgi:hypothetical protein
VFVFRSLGKINRNSTRFVVETPNDQISGVYVIQIARETILLLDNSLHKSIRDNCSVNLRLKAKFHRQSFLAQFISHFTAITVSKFTQARNFCQSCLR